MNYRSFEDLQKCLVHHLDKVPHDIDFIVGIPRSGLLVANLLALYMELPFTDLEGFLEGRFLSVGRTRGKYAKKALENKRPKILVIDDSARTGISLAQAKEKITAAGIDADIIYGVVYIVPEIKKEVDLYFEVCPLPRMFEWNLFHHYHLQNSCVDIDGVLCRNPTQKENDDGEAYRNFISTVQPKIIPSREIGWLVTCRLEKYRALTEEWLAKNGVQYRNLVMMDYPDMQTRQKMGKHAEFKADVYCNKSALLFIESSLDQAQKIANISGKQVFCVDAWKMIEPTKLNSKVKFGIHTIREKFIEYRRKIFHKIKSFLPSKNKSYRS